MLTLLNDKAHGAGQNGIYLNSLKKLEVHIPSISDQKTIIAKLDGVYEQLELAKQAIDRIKSKYNELKSAILKQELQSEAA